MSVPSPDTSEYRPAVRGAVGSVKNALLKFVLNRSIKAYGTMTRLEIDSEKKTMRIELALQGETEPILIEVGAYSVETVDGKLLLSVDKISTSRKWLTTLASEYLANRKIPIPKSASMAL